MTVIFLNSPGYRRIFRRNGAFWERAKPQDGLYDVNVLKWFTNDTFTEQLLYIYILTFKLAF